MSVQGDLQKLADKEKATFLLRFFKTEKGEYGEGDVFLGITVPKQREVAKTYKTLPLPKVETLIHDKFHEYRLTALLILCEQFAKADEATRKQIVDLYLSNTRYINNWDLVDLSAHHIVGGYLSDKPDERRRVLSALAHSKSLWERRIAVIATFAFIRMNDFTESFRICEILLVDSHDLIHKAVGWMLREVGKRDQAAEEEFLAKHYKTMPRMMLRYAIERFPKKKRKYYLA